MRCNNEPRVPVMIFSDNPYVLNAAKIDSNNAGSATSTAGVRKYAKSSLTKKQKTVLLTRLNRAMVEDRLYLDNMLNLSRLAQHIGSRAHDVSQVLNQAAGKGFFDYINEYRIKTAIELLRAPERLSMFDIAMETGFNSKSTFYLAFKKQTNMTPYQYKLQCVRDGEV